MNAIDLDLAYFLATLISFLLAYVISITGVGWFRAWIASVMGDNTGCDLGYCTLNPLAHVHPLGVIFLLFGFVGWGRYIPVNPINIRGPFKTLKLACAYLAPLAGHLLLAIFGICGLVLMLGGRVLSTVEMIMGGKSFILPRGLFMRDFPHSPSYALTLAFIFLILIYLNVILAILHLFIDGFYFWVQMRIIRSPVYREYNGIVLFLLPLILVTYFANDVRMYFVIPFMRYAGQFIAFIFGIS